LVTTKFKWFSLKKNGASCSNSSTGLSHPVSE
jgi:hypothetical protein